MLTAASLAAGLGLAWLAGRREEGDLFGGRSRAEALREWSLEAPLAWGVGALIFVSMIVLFYSSFFSHWRGVPDFFGGYLAWFEYGATGRNQDRPFGYFWVLVSSTMGPLRWTALVAAGLALATRQRLGLFLTGWAAAAGLIYSLIPYKTPWCALQIDLPCFLTIGWAAGQAWRSLSRATEGRVGRALAWALLLGCVLPVPWLLHESIADIRKRYDDSSRPYVFYQTYREYRALVHDVVGVWQTVSESGGRPLRVVNVGQDSPLRWYTLTRGWPDDHTEYVEAEPLPDSLRSADLIVSDSRFDAAIDERLENDPAWIKRRYYVRPGIFGYVWYRKEHWEPYAASLRPNVLLISIDTLRADHLGAYGYARPTSPNIDALGNRGVVFSQALSTSSWTLPAHASLLTGRTPSAHGLQDDGLKLAADVPTLAAALQDAGYHTVAVVSQIYVSAAFGLERGFAHYDDSLIEGGRTNPIAAQVVKRVLKRLSGPTPEPFFAFVHFFDPHWPYTPPPSYAERFADPGYDGPVDGSVRSLAPFFFESGSMPEEDRAHAIALYDAEIAYVDAQVGRLLDGLEKRGQLENTVVILTSDHGEEFKEHGRLGHGRTLYAEQLHVPLIISGHPGLGSGIRRDDVVSIVDVAPTVTELAGVAGLEGVSGHSLVDGEARDTHPVIAESIRFGTPMRALRSGPFKLIRVPSQGVEDFYDLRRDPGEHAPLAEDPSGRGLASAMDAYSSTADSGWHLKFLGLGVPQLRCRLTVRTSGELVQPRHYAPGNVSGRSASFDVFSQDPSAPGELRIDVSLTRHVAEVVFETQPADAPVSFELDDPDGSCGAGLLLGRTGPAGAAAVELHPSDPRLAEAPFDYKSATPGLYIHAVESPAAGARASELSKGATERLEALGYRED